MMKPRETCTFEGFLRITLSKTIPSVFFFVIELTLLKKKIILIINLNL